MKTMCEAGAYKVTPSISNGTYTSKEEVMANDPKDEEVTTR